MGLLDAVDYPTVRAALDVSLTEAELPDATIARDLYAGAARREVLARDPAAEGRAGDALARVKLAAALWCASLIAPALPAITRESHGDDSYQRATRDPATLAAELRARAEGELAAVLGSGSGARTPRPFATTCAARFTTDMP